VGAVKAAFVRLGLKPFAPGDVEEWRRGWRIVAGAAVGLGTGISLYLLLSSLFIKGMTEEFKWSRGDMGTAGAFAFIVGAISLSIVGKIIDRVGFRPVVMVCAPALALLYIMIAQQPGVFWFYLVLMVWGGVFGAGTGAIAYTRPVVASFVRQRGLALGMATCGVSLMSIFVAPMLSELIEAHGWRTGLYALAVVTTVIGLPVALILIASAREAAARAVDDVPDAETLHVPDVTIGQALRMPSFWLIVAFAADHGQGVLGRGDRLRDVDLRLRIAQRTVGDGVCARPAVADARRRRDDDRAGDRDGVASDPDAVVCDRRLGGAHDRAAAGIGGRPHRLFRFAPLRRCALRRDLWARGDVRRGGHGRGPCALRLGAHGDGVLSGGARHRRGRVRRGRGRVRDAGARAVKA
jgi:hypothetical protein